MVITPSAGYVTYGQSLLIGVMGALISHVAVHWQNSRTTIDDTLDVFPCHGLGGIGDAAYGCFRRQGAATWLGHGVEKALGLDLSQHEELFITAYSKTV